MNIPLRRRRPFYAEYAWAYDLLVDRPVRRECDAIITWLVESAVRPGATLLDAGCGTGRYAIELARRGYIVHGIDASPEQIAVARQSAGEPNPAVSFSVGDILVPADRPYDAVLCRGVLNDVVEDSDRDAVFDAFAQTLRSGGVLILDAREWTATAERKAREPLFRKRVATDAGTLTFTSVTTLDPDDRRLLVAESHVLVQDGHERSAAYQFVMRCWTRQELDSALERHGFTHVAYYGAYDAAVETGQTDRLVAVSRRAH